MPIQTASAGDERGLLEVFADFEAGLSGIDGFEYVILITRMHVGHAEPLEVVPFLDDERHGVFSTRAPARPNRLGLSIVRLIAREGRLLHFVGNDMLDGTPVLDVKPYVPKFDVRQTNRVGWYAERVVHLSDTRSDNRMAD